MRRILLIAIVIAGLAGAVIATMAYQPLATGSTSAADQRFLLTTTDDDDRTTYHFPYAPSAEFSTMFSVRNSGPVPLTLIGVDNGDQTAGSLTDTALVWPERLSLARRSEPTGDMIDAASAPVVDHAVIEPDQELGVWIRWRVGSWCPPGEPASYMPGGAIIFGPTIDLTWSLFSIPRTSTVDLGYDVSVENPIDAPLVICPKVPG